MGAIQRISEALQFERGFAPLTHSLRAKVPEAHFMCTADYFNIPFIIAGFEADSLAAEDLRRITHSYRGVVLEVRDSFRGGPFMLRQVVGQMWLFYSSGLSAHQVGCVRENKIFGLWPPISLIPLAIDLQAGVIQRHRGLPVWLWPGRRFIRSHLTLGESAA